MTDMVIPLEELGKTGTVKVYNQSYVNKQQKRIAELEEKISILLSCKNCPENKGGLLCQKEYEDKCLSQKTQYIKELQEEIAELKAQIEKMKCCQNCKFEDNDCIEEPCSSCTRCLGNIKRKGNSDKWELQEDNNE